MCKFCHYARKVIRMNHIVGCPCIHLLGRVAEVLQDPAVEKVGLAGWIKGGHPSRNTVESLPEIAFTRPQLLLCAFLLVDVGGRTDEFEDFAFCIAQDHGLLEVPAIGPVPSAERPDFERKTLSRAYSLPKGPRCCVPILGVDRSHPGLGMRPDEIEGLTGVFKPNSIHEIRCPIRLERPGGHRKMLEQPNLELELCVRRGKFGSSLRDPLIEFVGHALLLSPEPCLLQPDGSLIRRDAKEKFLGLPGKIRTMRSSRDYAHFPMRPQPHEDDRNVLVINTLRSQRGPLLRVTS